MLYDYAHLYKQKHLSLKKKKKKEKALNPQILYVLHSAM